MQIPIIRDGKHLLPSNKKKRFCCFIGTNNVIDLTSLSLSLRWSHLVTQGRMILKERMIIIKSASLSFFSPDPYAAGKSIMTTH